MLAIRHVILAAVIVAPLATSTFSVAEKSDWRTALHDFTAAKLQHSAWGLAHSKRNYRLAGELAAKDGVAVDDDVLYAAAYLHDMGGFPEFAAQNVDHAVRSAELAPQILRDAGFPESKIAGVQAAILTHSYYDTTTPTTTEAMYFHDADALDFLGIIGLARIVSLTERETFAPNLAGSVRMTSQLLRAAPPSLISKAGKAMGVQREAELRAALETLNAQSAGGSEL